MIFTLFSTIMFVVQNIAMKEYGRRYPSGIAGTLLFNAAQLLVVCVLTAILGGCTAIPFGAFLLAALFGICLSGTLIAITQSYACGSTGLTALIANASLLIPSVFSVIYWKEPFSVWKAAAIALILVMLAMTSLEGGKGEKLSKKWYLYILPGFVLNGTISVIQKFYTTGYPAARFPACTETAFSFYSALCAAVCCLIGVLVCRMGGTRLAPFCEKPARFTLISAATGIGTTGGTVLTMYALSAGMPATVLFPVRQGLLVLIMWVFGLLRYKEKLTKKGLLILLVGLAGIVLINF